MSGGKLTAEQIKDRIKEAFPLHRTAVEIYDYDARIRFEVTDENGRILATMPELLVDDLQDPSPLKDVLDGVRKYVTEKAKGPVELDDCIRVKGRKTTLRKEHQAGRVTALRGNQGPVIGQDPFGHWALIDGQSFPVSAADHASLRGDHLA